MGGFRSEFTGSSIFDRTWQPYCCIRAASTLINCQIPASRYENDLRGNLNVSTTTDQVMVGVESFYFNRYVHSIDIQPSKPHHCTIYRDRRWRFEVCQIEGTKVLFITCAKHHPWQPRAKNIHYCSTDNESHYSIATVIMNTRIQPSYWHVSLLL